MHQHARYQGETQISILRADTGGEAVRCRILVKIRISSQVVKLPTLPDLHKPTAHEDQGAGVGSCIVSLTCPADRLVFRPRPLSVFTVNGFLGPRKGTENSRLQLQRAPPWRNRARRSPRTPSWLRHTSSSEPIEPMKIRDLPPTYGYFPGENLGR